MNDRSKPIGQRPGLGWRGGQMPRSLAVLAVVFAVFTGCKSVHWSKAEYNSGAERAAKAAKDGKAFGTPTRMVAIWRDAVYEQSGIRPARGFGGRFYFYDAESKPVRVNGELIVYAFDENTHTGGRKKQSADRKYVFQSDELQQHFSETALGPSYSFWIPWGDVGGERMSVALIPVLKSEEGTMIRGDQTVNILSGRAPETTADARIVADGGQIQQISEAKGVIRDRNLQQAGFVEGEENSANVVQIQNSIRKTTTFEIPPGSSLNKSGYSAPGPQTAAPSSPGPEAAAPSRSGENPKPGSPQSSSRRSPSHSPASAATPPAGRPAGTVTERESAVRSSDSPAFRGWSDFKTPLERRAESGRNPAP